MERTFQDRFKETITLEPDTRLEIKERASGNLVIKAKDSGRLEIDVHPYSHARILMAREPGKEIEVEVKAEIARDAKLEWGFLDLEDEPARLHLVCNLNEEGATAETWTGQLAGENGSRISDLKVLHKARHTFGTIHNFAVVKDKGSYEMAATGAIEKGCRDSESHQETRVLTLGDGHKTKVLPILLIDENDVKASHAMTVGQPDMDQLYYLESRGLTAEAAMGLLAIGYFLPVIDLADDESLKAGLRETLERKAGLYGHQ